MTRVPSTLTAPDFAAFPPEAKALAVEYLPVLRQTALPLLPILLREVALYDWKFPRERARIKSQLAWLGSLPPEKHSAVVAPFAALTLPPGLDAVDWISDPGGYMEQLTAALWSTGAMPRFREAASAYAAALREAVPEPMPTQPRLGVVVFGADLRDSSGLGARFAKLRARGVLLTKLDPAQGFEMLLEHVHMRAGKSHEALAHWYVDGGAAAASPPAVTTSSYAALEPVRQQLLQRARNVMNAERSGPEELRSLMARLRPNEVGLSAEADPVLAHFQLSLLTEGSGTQIFATTFVQWAARECLRRAEPETLLARFRARQRQQDMNEMISGQPAAGLDFAGSLSTLR